MKFKLVECHLGREIGFKQDIVLFIQGTDDNKTWNNYVWCDNSPSIVFEKELIYCRGVICPPPSAYLTLKEANESFDKITNYYKKQIEEKPDVILREEDI